MNLKSEKLEPVSATDPTGFLSLWFESRDYSTGAYAVIIGGGKAVPEADAQGESPHL